MGAGGVRVGHFAGGGCDARVVGGYVVDGEAAEAAADRKGGVPRMNRYVAEGMAQDASDGRLALVVFPVLMGSGGGRVVRAC